MKRTLRALLLLLPLFVLACGWLGTPELDPALTTYEEIRGALAQDDIDTARARSAELAGLLAQGTSQLGSPDDRAAVASAASKLAEATDLDQARLAFGEVSEPLIVAIAGVPELQRSVHRYSCPMAKGYGHWIQPEAGVSNPYMGTSMPTCGTSEGWESSDEHNHAAHADPDAIAYWTCAMHPSVRESEAGLCPICSMDLTPVTGSELTSGAVVVDALRRQRFGVRTVKAEKRPLVRDVRATAQVVWDEDRLADVTTRTDVWVERVLVSEPGTPVRRGQPLAVLYSPELYAAQREWLASRGSSLEGASRRRLGLFGLTEGQIAAIATRGEASDTTQLLSPASGVLIQRHVVDGAHVSAGTSLFRVGDLDRIWIEAEVYEDDLPMLESGMPMTLEVSGLSDPILASVDTFQPWVDPQTRRATVRSVLDNREHRLVPGQFLQATLSAGAAMALAVPVEAVIITGERRIVFVDAGDDRLVPREVTLGIRSGGWFEVKAGLEPGEAVVASGTFLIAAESRIRAAQTYWGHDGTE